MRSNQQNISNSVVVLIMFQWCLDAQLMTSTRYTCELSAPVVYYNGGFNFYIIMYRSCCQAGVEQTSVYSES